MDCTEFDRLTALSGAGSCLVVPGCFTTKQGASPASPKLFPKCGDGSGLVEFSGLHEEKLFSSHVHRTC